MANSGHASYLATHDTRSPGERRADKADREYFAANPESSRYVRRKIKGEADSADSGTVAEWADIEWVLVTLINDSREWRERTPLHIGDSTLVGPLDDPIT
jgi:hypothetical protein